MSISKNKLNLTRQAKLLTLLMSDNKIINALKRHFSIEVARKIRSATISNLKDSIIKYNRINKRINFREVQQQK